MTYSESLTPHEINESIDASENLIAVIDYINAMQHRSEIKEFRRSLASVALNNRFNPDEVDVLVAALNRRDFELSAKSIEHGVTEEAWSPSHMLPPETSERDPDWFERQLASGDR